MIARRESTDASTAEKEKSMTMRSPRTAIAVLALALAALLALAAPAAAAEFEIESFDGSNLDAGGVTYTQAGGHPDTVATEFTFTQTTGANGNPAPAGAVKDVVVELPPGLIGDPTAVPRCSHADFSQGSTGNCPKASQVGTAQLYATPPPVPPGSGGPVYSLIPPRGVAAEFGFRVLTNTVTIQASVRTGSDYGITMSLPNVAQALGLYGSRVVFWGVPASKNGGGLDPTAFISLPTSCHGPQATTLRVNSWQNEGVFDVASFLSHDTLGNPVGITGCDLLGFDPSITVRPDTAAADSPTGLDVELRVPQNESANVPAEAHLKDAVVTLPEGIALNPSSANGLESCTQAQADLDGPDPVACPDASKVGSVEIKSPLLDDPLTGGVYLATPHQNPFGSMVAIYVSAVDPRSGTVIKLPGRVDLDPRTGRMTTTFEENPQLPFESFNLHFFGGPRASMVTPPTCGAYTASAALTPWSENGDAHRSDSFEIGSGPGGAACDPGGVAAPNRPAFEAGTRNPLGGAHSPFLLGLARADGSQQLGTIKATLPPGLLAKLAGIPYCPDAALAAAGTRSGAEEKSSPSCPAASRIGSVTTGSGAGPEPYYVEGQAYLAGPYKGAPLSLAFVTPVVAGPFDLGTVVVRSALHLDPSTAQVTTVSDPLPTILDGIPLNLRSVAINLDRPEFTLNPTSCEEMSVAGESVSLLGQAAPVATRFQVGSCASLGFEPRLSLRLKGGTKRGAYPALTATLRMGKGESNIRRASVALPRSEFLAQEHIRTICTRVQWAAESCPKGAIYGHAEAITPLLDEPLKGPVYLRSSDNELPDLVADLEGQIDIELVGRIDSFKRGLRTTFESVPDAPVRKFVLRMRGGSKSLLVNSTDVCRRKQRATVVMDGQNGRGHDFRPVVKMSCGKKKRGR